MAIIKEDVLVNQFLIIIFKIWPCDTLKVRRWMFVELDIDEMEKIVLISMNVLILKETDAIKNGRFA